MAKRVIKETKQMLIQKYGLGVDNYRDKKETYVRKFTGESNIIVTHLDDGKSQDAVITSIARQNLAAK